MILKRIERSQRSVIGLEERVLVRPVLTEFCEDVEIADGNLRRNGGRLNFLGCAGPETGIIIEPLIASVEIQVVENFDLRISGNTLPEDFGSADAGSKGSSMVPPVD